jgi:glc operon protein GlcG
MKALLTVVALGLLPGLAEAAKPYVEEVLTLTQARDLVEGCERHAAEREFAPLSMAVYDAAGNVKLFARQDGALLVTVDVAHIKGRTSALTALATRELAEIEFANTARPVGIAGLDVLTILQGGVALKSASGQHLGGFGVSGASAEDDEACAQAGIAQMLAPEQ